MGKTLSLQLFSIKYIFLVCTQWISIAHAGISCVLLTAKVPPPSPSPPPSFLLLPQVERFGKPTWRRLAEAVKDHVGGNNCALAQTIARDHPGAPGNHIYMVMYIVIQCYYYACLQLVLEPLPAFIACVPGKAWELGYFVFIWWMLLTLGVHVQYLVCVSMCMCLCVCLCVCLLLNISLFT